jgi:YD repeat-containing protein
LNAVRDWGNDNPTSYSFSQAIAVPVRMVTDCLYNRVYSDRRGKEWAFYIDDTSHSRRVATQVDPLSHENSQTYDAANNVISFKNALDHEWTATYGLVGNIKTLTSPLPAESGNTQKWTITWEQPDETDRPNFWRATQVSAPKAKHGDELQR